MTSNSIRNKGIRHFSWTIKIPADHKENPSQFTIGKTPKMALLKHEITKMTLPLP
jgi:hypothetical protein